ncbi:hypothetical protein GJY59_08205 [Salmonella enterica]|uniref:hypothetical protein n=1 Tax=Salmonella enterica TaxID=28901 RepID=UPI00142C13DC|nr:hypothetical protein [Salmonella enterica]EEB5004171.1 hypothetical protein [Salmonella enterica]EEB8531958.1 hypothetical protein [Salmonella enterica]EEC1121303.1 hypothetical protein [Salmonella enterica]EEI6955679.1 hypothetical protein [Salmonella enterica]EEO4982948.1 hypothetical protein [Salmonella enterica]
MGNGLAPDGALLIRPMHCVKSRLDNARRTGHTSALLLISFLNERANQRNGNEHNSILFQLVINLLRLFFVATGGFSAFNSAIMPFLAVALKKVATEMKNSGNERGCAKTHHQ